MLMIKWRQTLAGTGGHAAGADVDGAMMLPIVEDVRADVVSMW